MSIKSDIESLIIAWLRNWLAPGITLTPSQVIKANPSKKNVRPVPPYLTVNVLTHDGRDGSDEVRLSLDVGGDLQEAVAGGRIGTVSIQGFGEETEAWLVCALQSLIKDGVIRLLSPLTIFPITPVNQRSISVDTAIEPRYQVDLRFDYSMTTEATPLPAMSTAQVDVILTSENPDLPDLPVSVTAP